MIYLGALQECHLIISLFSSSIMPIHCGRVHLKGARMPSSKQLITAQKLIKILRLTYSIMYIITRKDGENYKE